MTKTTIGFDAKRIVRNATGLGNYCRTLVRDLARVVDDDWQLRLYTPDAGRDDLRLQLTETERLCYVYPHGWQLKPLRSLWRVGPIVNDLLRDGVQLYHGLTGELPIGIRRTGIRSVVTIHDLIFMRHPEYYHATDVKIYTWKFRQTLREADRIIAISERTRQDIMELGGISGDRIDVVYQSCSPRFAADVSPSGVAKVRHQYGLSGRFILSVGTIEERKNVLLAVKALAHLPEEIHFVAVGRSTKYAERVVKEAARMGLSQRVHLLHGVSDSELNVLYHEAEAFVYPSRYEGFGIPIIEAIHSGLPVVAATGSCLEEAGGSDCMYVSPDDSQGLAAAVGLLLRGAPGREERIRRSRDYVRRFEGTDVASQVLSIYQQLL
ncbi:MAG: glycosyltransferase family 4 protein [Prevotella sp.]|jgi:glycosyltransferase involved in cell wall biosynthesis|nr:glycosyltransferase family 4 protein [Prevotella sp.]